MSENQYQPSEQEQQEDGMADATAATAVILIVVGLVSFWLSNMPS